MLYFCIVKLKPKKDSDKGVSSSSLVRTSGFHPGNSGSNPGETTTLASLRAFFLVYYHII